MIEGASSQTISMSNIITSSPSGGRFDFDDGGTYCGGWQDGKAHGHGVCTGPKNVGEYSGSWNFGFEMSGVYKWTNGAVYEGRWQNGKRHGVGVEYNGKWIYKGEWSQGLKGRYGVKASSNSAVKYEGTWANGLQDGYGSETYSDGGYYQGQMCRGLRHGYGVRKSAPYGDSQLNNPNKNGPIVGGPSSSMLIHSNSVQSTGSSLDLSTGRLAPGADDDSPKPEDGFKPNIDRTLVSKNGFVLVSKPLDVPMPNPKLSILNGGSSSKRRNSFTNKLANTARIPNNTTATLLRGLRLKKQKSTSDLDAIGGAGSRSKSGHQQQQQSQQHQQRAENELPMVPFTLSPEELDITDPATVETYTGEWKHDKRNGHGVCDRSDGLKYEGQWHNDMKCGYGVTTFKDGTKEEGKYKNNILIVDSKVKRFFQLGGTNIRQRIDDSIKMAQQAQTMALKKAEIADTRAATARDKADQAMTAAIEADRDSQIAYSVARQYSDSQLLQQQQQQQVAAGFPPAIFGNTAGHLSGDYQPYLQNMATSPLQMRRISQHQQKNFPPNQANNFQQHQAIQQQQQQRQQLNASPQLLGPVEPFNGRRGSFRGGGGTGVGPSARPPSSNFRFGDFRSQQQQQQQHQQQHQYQQQLQPQHLHQAASMGHKSADPFGDFFDHYKTSSYANYPSQSFRSRRGMLGKQTSLDYNHLRQTSVPRQLGMSNNQQAGSGKSRFFRMSSLDHTNDEGQQMRARNSQDSINQTDNLLIQKQQQQFKHLVTSGESPVDFHNQFEQASLQQTVGGSSSLNAPTPAGSSYILPQSSGAGSASTAATNYNISNRTPSPSERIQSATNSAGTSNTAFYAGQQQHQNYAQAMMMQQQYQRDVQSLADEQLYITRRRNIELNRSDKSDYLNYDFIISNEPRPAQKCMRRTASLSRTTPINASQLIAPNLSALQIEVSPVSASHGGLASWSTPTTASNKFQSNRRKLQNTDAKDNNLLTADRNSWLQTAGESGEHLLEANNLAPSTAAMMMSQLSPNSCESSLSSGSLLSRKPSLQVRYDPIQLGGLMSREEVAALSHAQREQKRIEAELAENRAKRPILHLVLSLKEFVTRHQLVIWLLFINLSLMKLFADLIL